MAKRISKRVREEAAYICSVRASNPDIDTVDLMAMFGAALVDEDITTDEERAVALAFDAWDAACEEDFRANFEHWAGGEALLRTGWSP